MRILAMDTSAKVCSVAVLEDGVLRSEQSTNRNLTHSEMLMPMVEAALDASGLAIKDMDLFAVAKGPGSFTGLRIGVSTVKALGHACGKPVCGVMTLDALAMNAAHHVGDVVALMDARRGQVYVARYRGDGRHIQRVGEPEAISLQAYLTRETFSKDVLLLGDGVAPNEAAIKELLGQRAILALPHIRLQRAASIAVLAEKMADSGENMDQDALQPLYLRLSQAERERARRLREGAKA